MLDPVKEVLTRRTTEIIIKEDLKKTLQGKGKLRVKFGIDPTAPDLHLGHTVPLLKLKELQRLGHKIILVIGDFTGRIGDPSGRKAARKKLSKEVIKGNMKTYKEQAGKILNLRKTEIVSNSAWFDKMNAKDFAELASQATIQQIRKRKEYQQRIEAGEDISFLELLYPLLQGYDSVMVKADIEIGGLDQKFNLLFGRQVQKRFGQKEQNLILTPLLIGLDGKEKMSQSTGNYIAISDRPKEMYGKLMSVPDELIVDYLELCTELPMEEIKRLAKEAKRNPMGVKKRLAYEITETYHSRKLADKAAEDFERVVQRGAAPAEIKTVSAKGLIAKPKAIDIVMKTDLAESKSDARRTIEQGGVEIAGKRVTNPDEKINLGIGDIIKIGKRGFRKVVK
jgi:tyrosyl-tRNA synthetase